MHMGGGTVISSVTSQEEGPGFESGGQPGPSLLLHGFSPGTPASSHSLKACIGDPKLSLYVNSCVSE